MNNSIKRVASIVLAVLGLAALVPTAQADTISCPHTKIRREVTTPLPSGWWNTPYVNSLQNTRVVTIGGRTALQCQYGEAGNIQRYAPDNQNCEAVAGGFRCTRASAGLRTFSTGLIDIPQTYLADLDRGRVTQPGADIWFQAETRNLLYIVPKNGARIGISGTRNRGYEGCRSARMSTNRISLRDIPVGTYVCVRTNEGRISEFRVNAVSPGSPKTLTIGYTTWAEN
ncbi:hypothetical protein [Oricola sp.]|uniref:hypothetical protein n=1 Tax=Oricola sp. TaxID=1979950 RepID=UPI0025CF16D3|nr:hypothetical protein [Oricola sp.]MCI5078714.1 hypothetical protein [Oricola sp.]